MAKPASLWLVLGGTAAPGVFALAVVGYALFLRPAAALVREPIRPIPEAASGREALTLLERSKPAPIPLDLMMPEMDGFEVLEAVRRDPRWLEIPVVIVTAKDLSAEERDWLKRHAERVFRKGACSRQELIGVVHDTIARRTAADAV